MTPTFEEYQKAKNIVDDYEKQVSTLGILNLEEFRKELTEYFKNNLIDGSIQLKEFEFETLMNNYSRGTIIPIDPCLEENYCGGNDEDIEKICKKYNVNFRIIYWCYHK